MAESVEEQTHTAFAEDEEVFVIPASFAQQRLWFFDQLEAGSAAYNIPVVYRIQGQLDVSLLQRSLQAIVTRHETLRTTFASEDEQPVQVIHPHLQLPLPLTDLSERTEAQREAELYGFLHQEAHAPFDLGHGPLLRTYLLKLTCEEHVLVVNMHHIISDGWSIGVFMRELAAFYEAFATGQAPDLPELTLQYADFSLWQQEWLAGEVLAEQLAYWKQQLSGTLPILELPSSRPRPLTQTFHGTTREQTLSKQLRDDLRALCQREGVTLYMTLLAAFKTLLYRLTGLEDILVGSPISGRNQEEIEGLIGFFVNTLVLRTDLSGTPSFRDLLQRVRQTSLGAFSAQDVPLEKLVEELQPERSRSHSPLFQVVFALNNNTVQTMHCADLTWQPLLFDHESAKFDLTLGVDDTAEGLVCKWNWNTDLLAEATMKRWSEHFATLLESIVTDPGQPIAQLALLTEQEQQHFLHGLALEKHDFLRRIGLQELVAEGHAQTGAVYVLDKHLQPVPVDVAGDVYLAGVAEAFGDLSALQLSEEHWVVSPFGARLYKTGIRACFRADGSLARLDEEERRSALQVQQKRPALSQAFIPPTSMAEEVLVDIWEEVLGVEQVGVQDRLADLGGDLLRAAQIAQRMQRMLEVAVPLQVLFNRETIAELAAYVEEQTLVTLPH